MLSASKKAPGRHGGGGGGAYSPPDPQLGGVASIRKAWLSPLYICSRLRLIGSLFNRVNRLIGHFRQDRNSSHT